MADEDFNGSTVVEHPNNPLISRILQFTAHLRPTNGLQQPGRPPTTQSVTKKQPRERESIRIPVLEKAQIPVHLPFETAMDMLEQREKILVAKAKTGESLDNTQMLADFLTIGSAKEYLRKKDRTENAGGRLGVILAERQKRMAELDGAPTDSLP